MSVGCSLLRCVFPCLSLPSGSREKITLEGKVFEVSPEAHTFLEDNKRVYSEFRSYIFPPHLESELNKIRSELTSSPASPSSSRRYFIPAPELKNDMTSYNFAEVFKFARVLRGVDSGVAKYLLQEGESVVKLHTASHAEVIMRNVNAFQPTFDLS